MGFWPYWKSKKNADANRLYPSLIDRPLTEYINSPIPPTQVWLESPSPTLDNGSPPPEPVFTRSSNSTRDYESPFLPPAPAMPLPATPEETLIPTDEPTHHSFTENPFQESYPPQEPQEEPVSFILPHGSPLWSPIILDLRSLDDENPSVNQAPFKIEEMWELLEGILHNKSRYRALLKSRDENAHSMLNLMQKMADHPKIPSDLRRSTLIAMMRLCMSSGAYPRCLALQQLVRYDSTAVASGRFGEIWEGSFGPMRVSLKVAKLYRNSQIEHLIKSFAKEAILWSHLSHPNLLPFYGIYRLGDLNERVCLVSPWMENGNVPTYLKAHPEVPRLPLVHEVLAGLEHLHKCSIVHGDLKGANILVSSSGIACLADFGLSSVVDAEILRWTSVETATPTGGTIRWEAPEIMDDSEDGGNPRPTYFSDVYAAGSVMYEILTGQMPYWEYPRDATVISKVLRGVKPTKPSSYTELELSEAIWEIMEECWENDPNKRPTASQVAKRLQSLPPNPLTEKRLNPTQGRMQKDGFPALTAHEFRSMVHGQHSRFTQVEMDLLKGYHLHSA